MRHVRRQKLKSRTLPGTKFSSKYIYSASEHTYLHTIVCATRLLQLICHFSLHRDISMVYMLHPSKKGHHGKYLIKHTHTHTT